MTRTTNYSKAVIYKIVCKDVSITNLYVGSTCEMRNRKCHHKRESNNSQRKYQYKLYGMIEENGGWDNWDMIMIEQYPCENKLQKEKRERYWIEELKADLNTVVPTRSKEEWKTDNPEKVKLSNVKFYENHKEERRKKAYEYKKSHRDRIQCECGASVTRNCYKRHLTSLKHIQSIQSIQ